ncbi:hypothetical protein LSM04_003371 [Trypanosoma melophagium]|uniref:uncharacterized protein n=1 Tax=Trypanosoma melophagium TaxID=715481 RepID=UPI00351A969F|nr:hypothetical protein LSM04_003371 [Trypanosoma melophagium]
MQSESAMNADDQETQPNETVIETDSNNPEGNQGGNNSISSNNRQQPPQDAEEETAELLPPSKGLTTAEAEELLAKYGRNELPEKKTPSWLIFVRTLFNPLSVALLIALVIKFALEYWADAAILLAIFIINALIGCYEIFRSGDPLAALKNSLNPMTTVFRDGSWQQLDAALLVPGDLVKLASGSAVPADCTINEGVIDVDEAALTGGTTSVPVGQGEMAKMGSNVLRGEVDGTVQFTGQNTVFGKTAVLLQSVESDLGNIHVILSRVTLILVSFGFVLAIICLIYLLAKMSETFRHSLNFAVIVFIASIPLALEIVITAILSVGLIKLSKHKVKVKNITSVETLARVNMLCSDKTGTLTLNKMEIQEQCFTFEEGHDLRSILVLAALAAKWREPPRDALDTMVLGAADLDECDNYTQTHFSPFDPIERRITASVTDNRTGEKFSVTKGAPHVIIQLIYNQDEINDEVVDIIDRLASRGIRCLSVAKTDSQGRWHLCGILTFLYPPRPDTKDTIRRSKEYGVDVKMITGDHVLIAREMCRMLNLDPNILTADKLPKVDVNDMPDDLGEKYGDMMLGVGGFAQVFPEHKFMIVETLRQRGFTCAMTGDGVNDAPALKRADVGIAVQGATDAARAAADMVLTGPGLSVVVEAMLVSRQVFQRMLSFLTYRISATLQLVCFYFIACFSLTPRDYGSVDPDFQFFHLPVLLFLLIVLLNDVCMITVGFDRVVPSKLPQRWNLPVVFVRAIILVIASCASSLMLLWIALEGWGDDTYLASWVFSFGLAQLTQGKVVMMLYLKITIFDFMTLFSARTGGDFFFTAAPGLVLFVTAVFSLLVSSMVGAYWHFSTVDNVETEGIAWGRRRTETILPLWVWIYCIIWWLIDEMVKVFFNLIMEYFDLFGCVSKAYGGKCINEYGADVPGRFLSELSPVDIFFHDGSQKSGDMYYHDDFAAGGGKGARSQLLSPVDVFTPRGGVAKPRGELLSPVDVDTLAAKEGAGAEEGERSKYRGID